MIRALGSARVAVAGLMLIIAGGRFGVWPALRQADTVPNALYAGALFIIGVII